METEQSFLFQSYQCLLFRSHSGLRPKAQSHKALPPSQKGSTESHLGLEFTGVCENGAVLSFTLAYSPVNGRAIRLEAERRIIP